MVERQAEAADFAAAGGGHAPVLLRGSPRRWTRTGGRYAAARSAGGVWAPRVTVSAPGWLLRLPRAAVTR